MTGSNIQVLHAGAFLVVLFTCVAVCFKNRQYRLEATQRGRWGGIFQVPRAYSFVSTSNLQTDVRLLLKFDSWYVV